MEVDFMPTLITWLGAAIAGGVGAYFGAYLSKKGENLATKEDVAMITRLQEGVRHEFQMLVEDQRAESDMRMAAIDRRFEAHQRAYTLWIKLQFGVHDEGNAERVLECQNFWEENGLYLDAAVRKAFYDAYRAAFTHPQLAKSYGMPRASSKDVEENFERILAAGPIIEAAVSLPPMGQLSPLEKADPEVG